MEPVVIAVQASDERLPDYYNHLASRLEGRGSVYVPHVYVPPNARMAIRPPPRLVIGLSTPDDVVEVEAWAREYLASEPGGELCFERGGHRAVVRAADLDTGAESLRSLVSD